MITVKNGEPRICQMWTSLSVNANTKTARVARFSRLDTTELAVGAGIKPASYDYVLLPVNNNSQADKPSEQYAGWLFISRGSAVHHRSNRVIAARVKRIE